MKLSIVIPAFNEEKLLPACLESVRSAVGAFEKRAWAWEVVVCDNNSTDQTAEIASANGARVVFEKINQIGRARNTGASVALGEWVVFLDADSTISQSVFEKLALVIESGTAIGGGACLSSEDELASKIRVPLLVWNLISRTFRWAAGSFLFCRKDVFDELGGFNLERFAGEELDLSRRIKRVAKRERSSFVILKQCRVQTSSRKFGLYSYRELTTTLLTMIFRYRGTTGNRGSCFLWYDGRR